MGASEGTPPGSPPVHTHRHTPRTTPYAVHQRLALATHSPTHSHTRTYPLGHRQLFFLSVCLNPDPQSGQDSGTPLTGLSPAPRTGQPLGEPGTHSSQARAPHPNSRPTVSLLSGPPSPVSGHLPGSSCKHRGSSSSGAGFPGTRSSPTEDLLFPSSVCVWFPSVLLRLIMDGQKNGLTCSLLIAGGFWPFAPAGTAAREECVCEWWSLPRVGPVASGRQGQRWS